MSHVIPLLLFQTLNLRRWNCNVFGESRKMTEGNYVRNLSGPGPLCPGRRSGSVVLTGLLHVAQLEGSGFFGPFVLRGLF